MHYSVMRCVSFCFFSQSFALMSDRQRKRKLQESLAPDSKLVKDSVSPTNLYLLCFLWDSFTNVFCVLLVLSGWDCSWCDGITEFRKHLLHECHSAVPKVRLDEVFVTLPLNSGPHGQSSFINVVRGTVGGLNRLQGTKK